MNKNPNIWCLVRHLFRASTLSSAVSSLANTGMSLTRVDEREKQAALEEEQARLKALKVGLLRSLTIASNWNSATQHNAAVNLRFSHGRNIKDPSCPGHLGRSNIWNKKVGCEKCMSTEENAEAASGLKHFTRLYIFRESNYTALEITAGTASERAPEDPDNRLVPCLHGGGDHQLGPGDRPLLHSQLHQQVRPFSLPSVTS